MNLCVLGMYFIINLEAVGFSTSSSIDLLVNSSQERAQVLDFGPFLDQSRCVSVYGSIFTWIQQQLMQNQKEQQKESIINNKADEESHSSSSSESRSNSSFNGRSADRNSESKQKGEAEAAGEGQDKKIVRYKYCCKICKHPDKSKRACVCVVPLSQRRADLGTGCRNCGCTGCSKEDFLSKGQDPEYHPEQKDKNSNKNRKVEPPKRNEQRTQRKRERSNSRKRNKSPRRKMSRHSSSRSRSPQYIDSASMKFYNFDRSLIGSMIINEYQLNPIMLGFGVPQRTYSYLFGRPK